MERGGPGGARAAPLVTLLTDFGLDDAYVGVVKGVILGINPAARLVDLSHAVPPQDVRTGAFLLMVAVDYFPPGTVHLAVVDPGVGTARRAIAVEAGGACFVAPDNGLLSWALLHLGRTGRADVRVAGEALLLGAGARAVQLADPRWWRQPVSPTFHARDLFGPVAAHLSRGVPLAELGTPLDRLALLPFPEPERRPDGTLRGEVVHVDRFGNLITNLAGPLVPADAVVAVGGRRIVGLVPTFGAGRGLVALVGSSGLVEIGLVNGSAASALGVRPGAEVIVAPRR